MTKKGEEGIVVLLLGYFFLRISTAMAIAITTETIMAIPTPIMVIVGSIGCGYSGGGVAGGASSTPR